LDKLDPTSPWVGTTVDGWIEQIVGCTESNFTLQWNFFVWMEILGNNIDKNGASCGIIRVKHSKNILDLEKLERSNHELMNVDYASLK
jgi:hypothetical protein